MHIRQYATMYPPICDLLAGFIHSLPISYTGLFRWTAMTMTMMKEMRPILSLLRLMCSRIENRSSQLLLVRDELPSAFATNPSHGPCRWPCRPFSTEQQRPIQQLERTRMTDQLHDSSQLYNRYCGGFHPIFFRKRQQWWMPRTTTLTRNQQGRGDSRITLSQAVREYSSSSSSKKNDLRPTLEPSEQNSDENCRVHAHAIKGRRPGMQDEVVAIHEQSDMEGGGGKSSLLAAVFDGHGGPQVSEYLKDNLYNTLVSESSLLSGPSPLVQIQNKQSIEECVESLTSTLKQLDDFVLKQESWNGVGSTALVVWQLHIPSEAVSNNDTNPLIQDEDGDNNNNKQESVLIVANIGDCRAVAGRVTELVQPPPFTSEESNKDSSTTHNNNSKKQVSYCQITKDHRPDDPEERYNIEKVRGGKVITYGRGYPARVNGILTVARAIGDRSLRPHVSGDPDIFLYPVKSAGGHVVLGTEEKDNDQEPLSTAEQEIQEHFVVLATDGLWEVMSSLDAVAFVGSHCINGTPKPDIPGKLARQAYRLGSYDNISVVIVWLQE